MVVGFGQQTVGNPLPFCAHHEGNGLVNGQIPDVVSICMGGGDGDAVAFRSQSVETRASGIGRSAVAVKGQPRWGAFGHTAVRNPWVDVLNQVDILDAKPITRPHDSTCVPGLENVLQNNREMARSPIQDLLKSGKPLFR